MSITINIYYSGKNQALIVYLEFADTAQVQMFGDAHSDQMAYGSM